MDFGNIFFLFDPEERTVFEAYNPYFAYSLLQVQRSDTRVSMSPRKFPVLVFLAKLLLEIALGRILGPFSRNLDIALLTLLGPDENGECEVADNMARGYVDAIEACLTAKKRRNDDGDSDDDEDSDSDTEGLDEESQCRLVLFSAVENLEGARTDVFKVQKDPNFPKKLKVSGVVPSRNISKCLNTPTTMNEREELPSNGETSLRAALPTGSLVENWSPSLFDDRRIEFSRGDRQ